MLRTISIGLVAFSCMFLAAHAAAADETAASQGEHGFIKIAGISERFIETVIEETGREFTGDPITLNVKDADLEDVLEKLADFTDLNFVVKKGVQGKVTADLRNVPWDLVLELILRINGLGYEIEGNVVFIARKEDLKRSP